MSPIIKMKLINDLFKLMSNKPNQDLMLVLSKLTVEDLEACISILTKEKLGMNFDDFIRCRFGSPMLNALLELNLTEEQKQRVMETVKNWD